MDLTGGAAQQADELERVAVDRSRRTRRRAGRPRRRLAGLPRWTRRLTAYGRTGEWQVELAITHRLAERRADQRNHHERS